MEPAFDPERYWQSRFESDYSLATVGWLSLGPAFNKWMYRIRRKLFLERVGPLLPPRFDVLDIGSVTGFHVELWDELGAESVTGVDITQLAVARLQRRFPQHIFIKADIGAETDFLSDTKFSVISAMDMLYHIVEDSNYEKAIENIARHLQPHGLFIFTENFLHQTTNRARHQVSRTLDHIHSVLLRNDLKPIMRSPVFVLMNSPADTSNRLHHIFWSEVVRLTQKHESLANNLGAALYPVELALSRTMREGPSTEMMVCVKRN